MHADKGQEGRLQAALDLTKALDGHLHCLDVVPLPMMADTVWGASPAIMYDEWPQEAANTERLRERLAAEDVPWDMDVLQGDFAEALLTDAFAADLVVLNKKLHAFLGPKMQSIAGKMLCEGRLVVVAVDEQCQGLNLAGPALVAWDGSKPAMHTIQRTVPLLKLASSVIILQIGLLDKGALPATEAAAYLARHGIKPNIEIVDRSDSVVERILLASRACKAGACYMGGYGHSRVREALFGGVTHELLCCEGPPLVIAH